MLLRLPHMFVDGETSCNNTEVTSMQRYMHDWIRCQSRLQNRQHNTTSGACGTSALGCGKVHWESGHGVTVWSITCSGTCGNTRGSRRGIRRAREWRACHQTVRTHEAERGGLKFPGITADSNRLMLYSMYMM